MDAKQNLLNAIEKNGWHLTPEGVDDLLHEKPNMNSTELVKMALNADLRNIGAKYLPENVLTGRTEQFEGPAVLQLVKLRNIAAPKENETSHTAPPMYKLTLTDGAGNCNCLVMDEQVSGLNLNTPPGTKILLKGTIKIKANLLILSSQNIQVLGGHVEYLVSKWKQAKDLSQHVRVANLTETAPPPWLPFGAHQTHQVDTSKKVFAQNENPTEEDGSEFSLARQAALAEAMEAKLKITKTFTQTTVDKSQVENAAAPSTYESRPQTSSAAPSYPAPTRVHNSASVSSGGAIERGKPAGRGRGRRGRNRDDDDDDDPREAKDAAKPSNITLFDLIKTKVDIKGGADEPAAKEPEREEPVRTYEDSRRGGYRGRGDGYGSRGGRGRGGPRNQFRQPAESQASSASKQVYDADDFTYELGDTTNVKHLKQTKPKPKAAESEAPAVTSKPANANASSESRYDNRKYDRDNNNYRDNYDSQDNYDNSSNAVRPESSNYKGRNYNPKHNSRNYNNNNNNAPNSNYGGNGGGGGYHKRSEQNYSSSQGASNYNNNDQPPQSTYNKSQKSKNYNSSNNGSAGGNGGASNNYNQQQYYQPASNVPPTTAAAANTVATTQAPLPPAPQVAQPHIIYQPPYIPKNQQAPPAPNTYYNQGQVPQQAYYEYYSPVPGQPQLIPAVPMNQPFYPPLIAAPIQAPYAPNAGGYYAPVPAENMYGGGGYGGPNEYSKPQREPRQWRVGDQCLAKYRDNEYYPAVIQKVLKNGSRFLVNYSEYDESFEVGSNDIQPKAYYNSNKGKNYNKNYNNNNNSNYNSGGRPANSARDNRRNNE